MDKSLATMAKAAFRQRHPALEMVLLTPAEVALIANLPAEQALGTGRYMSSTRAVVRCYFLLGAHEVERRRWMAEGIMFHASTDAADTGFFGVPTGTPAEHALAPLVAVLREYGAAVRLGAVPAEVIEQLAANAPPDARRRRRPWASLDRL